MAINLTTTHNAAAPPAQNDGNQQAPDQQAQEPQPGARELTAHNPPRRYQHQRPDLMKEFGQQAILSRKCSSGDKEALSHYWSLLLIDLAEGKKPAQAINNFLGSFTRR